MKLSKKKHTKIQVFLYRTRQLLTVVSNWVNIKTTAKQTTANGIFFGFNHTKLLICPFCSLPAALLHLIGCDWLCPEAFAGLTTTAWPAREVTAGAPPTPFRARLHSQVQRGRGSPGISAVCIHKHRAGRREREEGAETKGNILRKEHSLDHTHMQMTLHSLGLCSTLRLLQKGASQLAYWHPSVELWGVESKRNMVPLPTRCAGRVLATLPGGGGNEWKQVRMQESRIRAKGNSQKQRTILKLSIKCCRELCNPTDERWDGLVDMS